MITVLGSINADLFFNVERLPARGETVLTPAATLLAGGKGANQAAAAARAGAATRFLGCVGDDAFAEPMVAALAEFGCDTTGIRRVDGSTGTAAVMVEQGGENQIVAASGANGAVSADLLDAVDLSPTDTLVCQMEIPVAATIEALARMRAAGGRTVLNLAPACAVDDAALRTVDALVANAGEAAVLTGRQDDPVHAAASLASAHGLTCIVTLGSDGAVAVDPEGTAWKVPALPVEAVDTVGAGDAFVRVLVAALDAGEGLPAALQRATVAAGLACTRPGAMTALPPRGEIEARLADLAPPTAFLP